MLSSWVAYRQESGPTAVRSPRVPSATIGVYVGESLPRLTFVIDPSLELTARNGGSFGFVVSATEIPSAPLTKPTFVLTPGFAELGPAVAISSPPSSV